MTDGVLEAPGAGRTSSSASPASRRRSTATPEAIAARLLAALRAHTGAEGSTHDDVTFFVGEFVEGPSGPTLGTC